MSGLGKTLSLCLISFAMTACNILADGASENTPEPGIAMETALAIAAATAEFRPTPTAPAIGTIENPLIVALPPGSASDVERVEAGHAFAKQLSEVTGYTFVVVAPESYGKLVDAIGKGNAHITVLSPYAYALTYEQGYGNAAFASLKSGEKTYGAQFIARTDAGFRSYYDAQTGENIADAVTALSQFREKKPCWPDEVSPSGYVIPSGVLAQNDIPLRTPAILQGQPTVVRAVYVGGICDFGATYIDARTFPAVLDEYPSVLDEVEVIWRIPPVIPYEVLVIAHDLSPEIAQAIRDALFRITGMGAGRQVLGKAYGINEWERITDAFYEPFRGYLRASGVNMETLLD